MARPLPNSVFIAPFNFRNIGRQELPQYIKLGPSQGGGGDFSKKSGGCLFFEFYFIFIKESQKISQIQEEDNRKSSTKGGIFSSPKLTYVSLLLCPVGRIGKFPKNFERLLFSEISF